MLSQSLLIGKTVYVALLFFITHVRSTVSSLTHRFAYRAVSEPRNIVVIGASFAGYSVAKCLAESVPTGYRVIVVEKNSHFQFTWVFPRFCVISEHEHKAFIPYGSYLRGAPEGSYRWVQSQVERIYAGRDSGNHHATGGIVFLASGEEIKYDYLVLATGSAAGLPSRVGKEEKHDGIQMLKTEQEQLKTARDVVVAGGGAAGVEIAADAKSQYPEKNITLVHSRAILLNGSNFGSRLRDRATRVLKDLGVNLVLGQRLQSLDEDFSTGYVTLTSGDQIPCDYLIKCIGQKPNSDLLTTVSTESITSSGRIRVLPTLQIADATHPNIYAVGDVADIGLIKNGRAAFEQGTVVAANIVRAIQGQCLKDYRQKWWEGITDITLGLGMVKNITQKGPQSSPVLIYNRTVSKAENFISTLEKGKATVVPSISEAVKQASVIFICVGDDAALGSVIRAILLHESGDLSSKTIVDCSTVHPETTLDVQSALMQKRAAFVACPVFGTPPFADAGQLVSVPAGSAEAVNKAKPYLTGVTSRAIIDMSDQDVSRASLMKVLGNSFILNMIESLGEALVAAEKSGLGTDVYKQWVDAFFPGPIAKYADRMVFGDYYQRKEPLFAVDLARKDLRHAMTIAQESDMRLRSIEVADGYLKDVRAERGENGDVAAVYGAIRKDAGLEFENGNANGGQKQ